MGFGFRKRIKIAPGVHVNIGKKGVSSVSLGVKGATATVGKKGVGLTASVPGTGLSYTHKPTGNTRKKAVASSGVEISQPDDQVDYAESGVSSRKVGPLLGIGIFVIPYIFAWFLLRKGYSKSARLISFSWMAFLLVVGAFGQK